ncbi:DUF1775 domain-containing protein [Streptomyces sp. KM273126]|uniref:DUF1775 domain-containing protein n=1 Tax=Streptomyces sp. KM273126 TaxID=2545247 RepID=UPI001039B0BA|nr:DUF1775 domain-containing protein [Streptomyces sp. KM273126]MBA2813216.1 DUF1775 domain-containing protein [Streptomyces sp. KM273126]
MPRTTRRPGGIRRTALAAAVAATAVLFTAGPAAAHVEVQSDDAQALAQNVELTFNAESESGTAGISELRVILPEGLEPTDVTYGEGPEGWKLTANKDGFTVKGTAVKVGEDAELSVVVRQLPDAKELVFKTLQTYSDGKVDRWIELGESGGDGHGHGNTAPVLKLKAAAPGAEPVSPSPSEAESESASPTPSAEPTEPSASPAAQATTDDDSGLSAGAWTGIGAGVIVVAGGAFYLVRRQGRAQE